MNDLTQKIIVDCYTKQQALRALSELSIAAQEYFFGKGALSSWQKELLGKIDKDDVDEIFKKTEEEIRSLPELVVYLAFEPDAEMVEKIGKTARRISGRPGIFLDFKLDSQLMGGAAISFGGVYRDYSLRARFEEKKEELREIYSKLLR